MAATATAARRASEAARFPARKTLAEFDLRFQHSIRRDAVLHLGQLDFLYGREDIVPPGPPGTGKRTVRLQIRAVPDA